MYILAWRDYSNSLIFSLQVICGDCIDGREERGDPLDWIPNHSPSKYYNKYIEKTHMTVCIHEGSILISAH